MSPRQMRDHGATPGNVPMYADDGTLMDSGVTPSGGGGGGGGGLALLASLTASSSASLDFATRNATGQSGALIQSDFDEYQIHVVQAVPASNNVNLQMRASTDGGSTYDSGSNYGWNHVLWVAGGTGFTGANSGASQIVLVANVKNTSNWSANGVYTLFAPGSAQYKLVSGPFAGNLENGVIEGGVLAGVYMSTTAVNALRFMFGSGNYASGTIRIYGVPK